MNLSIAVIIAALCATAPARAHDDEAAHMARYFAPHHASEAGIDLALTAGMWIPRMGGDVKLAPGDLRSVRNDLALGSSEPTINAELSIRKHERWELNLSGFHFETTGRDTADLPLVFGGIALAPGDAFRSEATMTSVSGELRFASAFRPLTKSWEDGGWNAASSGRPIADLRFMPLLGARWVGVDHRMTDLSPGGSSERVRGEWAVPYAGAAFELSICPELPFVERLRLETVGAAGPALGGDGGFAWHIRAGATVYFTNNFGLTLGYRLMELSVKRHDYELRGGLQGLFVGGTISF